MCEILSVMIYHTLNGKFRTKDRSRLIGSLFCRELMRNTLHSVLVVQKQFIANEFQIYLKGIYRLNVLKLSKIVWLRTSTERLTLCENAD